MHGRWDKNYQACYLDEIPHKRLTAPAKVFEYFFEGTRKGRGRENIIKLAIEANGTLNAIAFWFDLHLDEDETITTGTVAARAPDNFQLFLVLIAST